MLMVLSAAGLCLVSYVGLLNGVLAGGRVTTEGFHGQNVLLGFALAVPAAGVFGPLNGLSLILALLLHEAGHWGALRILGRDDAPFRLFPAPQGGPAGGLRYDAERVFHALMGPGVSLGPMVLSLALARMLSDAAPAASMFFVALTVSLCVLNLVNLMPFRLLDGGITAAALSRLGGPTIIYLSIAAAVAGLAALGQRVGLGTGYLLPALALAGLLFRPRPSGAHKLSGREARFSFAAWVSLIGAYLATLSLLIP